jgi:chromosomal replication initiator protein
MVEIAIMPSVASIATPAQKPQAPALPLAGQLPVTPDRIHVRRVIKATAEHFGTTVPALLSRCRKRQLTRRRRVAMYVAREMTGRSLSFIGSEIGGRDHSTVLHSVRVVRGLLDAGDAEVTAAVEAIMERLKVTRGRA